MQRYSVAVIGGGASGLVAAISAKRKGLSCVICEKTAQVGKKVLASGNGRCNLSNDNLSESHYNELARPLVKTILGRFGHQEIESFFKDLGLYTCSQEGRVFPVTNQSSSVLKVLDMELKRLAVPIEFNFDVSNISRSKDGFSVTSKSHKKIGCDSVILTGGGRSYPSFGSDGSAYKIAVSLGHKVIMPIPIVVPLVVKSPICHLLQGQRISAIAKSIIDNKVVEKSQGEVLFTKYGLSGTAILDVSESISIAINRLGKVGAVVSLDLVPFMNHDELYIETRRRIDKNIGHSDLLTGILPNKFSNAFAELIKTKDALKISSGLKDTRFKVEGTKGWNEAEFTSGGVDVGSIKADTLESNNVKGLYFAGEVLDVNGKRGGYNLAWAWASGFIAGQLG